MDNKLQMKPQCNKNKKLRSPLCWFGGKGQMTSKIVPIIESIPHATYVEPFCGVSSAAL